MASWIAHFEVHLHGRRLGWYPGGVVDSDAVPAAGDRVSFDSTHPAWEHLTLNAGSPAKVLRLHHLVAPGNGPSTMVYLQTTARVGLDELAQVTGWLTDTLDRDD